MERWVKHGLLFRPVSLFCWMLVLLAGSMVMAGDKYKVAIRQLQVPAGESIVSFEITLIGGRFVDVSNLPLGWHLEIDNDPSWQTEATGSVIVGAAWLAPETFKKLQLVIEKSDLPELKLSVSGTVSVSKNYETTATIPLKMSDFALAPAP